MSIANKFNLQSSELILDEGIPLEPFKKLNFPSIKLDEDSKNHVGLRISYVLVVISGKYISILAIEHRYDKDNPEKRELLPNEWFQLDEKQFDLLKKMKKYFSPIDSTYCFLVDTCFDDALLFETYFSYISSYESFNVYKNHMETHAEEYFKLTYRNFDSKCITAIENERVIRMVNQSMISGIEAGMIRSL